MSLPLVAIIGRPNVGKSSLFNRLCSDNIAIVSEIAGTTRDRIYSKIENEGSLPFLLVDTGGLDFEADESLEKSTQEQAKIAIKDSDIIMFLIDGTKGVLAEDFEIAEYLRKNKQSSKVILLMSKCDNDINKDEGDFYKLGFGKPIKISAVHKVGINELFNEIDKTLKNLGYKKNDLNFEKGESGVYVSILGKPNAGKSSLINAFLNEEKLIVSEIPGTTRDSIDTDVKYEGKTYTLIDTAGIRRAGKIEKGIEKYSLLRTIRSIERSDISCILIDSQDGLTAQDMKIISLILEKNNGLILVVNKWDLKGDIDDGDRDIFIDKLRRKLPFIPWAPVLFMSAKTKKGIVKIFPLIDKIYEERNKRITTGKLNTFVAKVTREHLPSGTKTVKPKIFYITQVGVSPPHFKIFVNKKEYFHFSYIRYIENKIREHFGFGGTGVSIEFVDRKSIYEKK